MKIGIICGKTSEECLDETLVKNIPKNYKIYDEKLLFSGYACLYFMLLLVCDFRVFYFR